LKWGKKLCMKIHINERLMTMAISRSKVQFVEDQQQRAIERKVWEFDCRIDNDISYSSSTFLQSLFNK
jgi:hypothetical protein